MRLAPIAGIGALLAATLWAHSDGLRIPPPSGLYTVTGPFKGDGAGVITSYAPARAFATPANPTGTASTAVYVMAGLAGTITPTVSGYLTVTITGTATSTVAADGCQTQIRYGTGAAPANGAAAAGTTMGNSSYLPVIPSTATFANIGSVGGLSVGTAYWIDLGQLAVTGGTCSLLSVTVVASEM